MTGYLLDTNHLTALLQTGDPLRVRVTTAQRAGEQFALCTPVIAEAFFWLRGRRDEAVLEHDYRALRAGCTTLPADEDDGEFSARLRIAARKRGRQLATVDGLIAALALRHDLTLLTADRDFHGIPSLRVENWLVP